MSHWKEWKKFWQTRFLLFSLLLCVFAPILMNHQPLFIMSSNGELSFPAFQASGFNESPVDAKFEIKALVPYSPVKSDLLNSGFKSPFEQQFENDAQGNIVPLPWYKRHWFGTDLRGSDVLAYTVYGLRNSFAISLIALLISLVIGAVFGFVSGWRVNRPLKINGWLGLVISLWMLFVLHGVLNLYTPADKMMFLSLVTIIAVPAVYFTRRLKSEKFIHLRFDFLTDRISEVFIAVPRMIILLVLIQYFSKSVWSLAFVIGITGWIDLARLIRSETMRLREQPFVDAARMTGQHITRLFSFHIFPNIWPSVMVVAMYGFSANVIMESSLSFFGLGLPPDQPSVGTILSEAKSYYEYWWLFVFPGLWLSLVIYALFTLPGRISKSKS